MNLIVFFLSLHYSKCLCYLLALVDRYAVNHAYCFFVQLCSFWCSWVESSLHDVRRTQHCRIEAVQALRYTWVCTRRAYSSEVCILVCSYRTLSDRATMGPMHSLVIVYLSALVLSCHSDLHGLLQSINSRD